MAIFQYLRPALAFLLLVVSCSGQVLLEDFDTVRLNGQGTQLWNWSYWDNQTVTIANGELSSTVTNLSIGGEDATVYIHFYPHQGTPRYPHPEGFLKSYIKSGTWDPLIDRMSFWIKCDPGTPHGGWRNWNVGTYVKGPSSQYEADQGAHYYHHMYGDLFDDRWTYVVMTDSPTGQVSVSGNTVIPNDPEWQSNWHSFGQTHYFDGMTRFYVDLDQHNGPR